MGYYTDTGYPALAVIESLMTIINSNYEEWRERILLKHGLNFNIIQQRCHQVEDFMI